MKGQTGQALLLKTDEPRTTIREEGFIRKTKTKRLGKFVLSPLARVESRRGLIARTLVTSESAISLP